jgi:hypothetical protein
MAKAAIRPIRIEGNIAFVTLNDGYEAIIDASDVSLVDGVNWCAKLSCRKDGSIKSVYAIRNTQLEDGSWKTVYMHRVIANTPSGMETDHLDGNGLNNRRENIRNATRAQNAKNKRMNVNNTSGFRGVYADKRRGTWRIQIKVDGKRKYKSFATLEEAASARADEVAKLYGAFSNRHFP